MNGSKHPQVPMLPFHKPRRLEWITTHRDLYPHPCSTPQVHGVACHPAPGPAHTHTSFPNSKLKLVGDTLRITPLSGSRVRVHTVIHIRMTQTTRRPRECMVLRALSYVRRTSIRTRMVPHTLRLPSKQVRHPLSPPAGRASRWTSPLVSLPIPHTTTPQIQTHQRNSDFPRAPTNIG